MNVQGRNVVVKLSLQPEQLKFKSLPRERVKKPKMLKRYRYMINNASYLTIHHHSSVNAERIALRSAKRSKDNLGTVKLVSITK